MDRKGYDYDETKTYSERTGCHRGVVNAGFDSRAGDREGASRAERIAGAAES